MANPQVENGHIDIANEIAEVLMRTNLSSYQYRVLWAIWRQTYGWHKKEDWISNSQLVEMTGLAKGNVSRTVKELLDRNIIIKSGYKLGFNKDYTQWSELPKGIRGYTTVINSDNKVINSDNKVINSDNKVINSDNKVINSDNKVINSEGHKRNYTKETLQKKNNITCAREVILSDRLQRSFDLFWNAYPKKKSKGKAKATWKKLNPDEQLLARILATIERAKKSEDWVKENGKFIPYPASWLNAEGWEDEFDVNIDLEAQRKAREQANNEKARQILIEKGVKID